MPQHRNGNDVVDLTFVFRSRYGRIVASKISDDDDDRVIEMTGGAELFLTLVIDFYVNDDNDNDEKSRVDINTRAMLLIVDELHIYTRMKAFLALSCSHSQSAIITIAVVLAAMLIACCCC